MQFLETTEVTPTVRATNEGKLSPVTGRRDPWFCETSMLPYFLDYRLANEAEVVSLTRRRPFTPRKIPGAHFR
jgi:hypothetical protein